MVNVGSLVTIATTLIERHVDFWLAFLLPTVIFVITIFPAIWWHKRIGKLLASPKSRVVNLTRPSQITPRRQRVASGDQSSAPCLCFRVSIIGCFSRNSKESPWSRCPMDERFRGRDPARLKGLPRDNMFRDILAMLRPIFE